MARPNLTIAFALLLLAIPALAQAPSLAAPPRAVTLAEAAAREGEDFRPQLLGEAVSVEGVVSIGPLVLPDAVYVALRDPRQPTHALLLVYSGDNRAQAPTSEQVRPGSQIRATGLVSLYAGQAVLKPESTIVTGQTNAPAPLELDADLAATINSVGQWVRLRGTAGPGETTNDTYVLTLASTQPPLRLVAPKGQGGVNPWAGVEAGDRITVNGLVTQAALTPPFNRNFQILLARPADFVVESRERTQGVELLPAVVMLVLLGILGAWYTQQKSARLNRSIQQILETSEALANAATVRDLADTLLQRLPRVSPRAQWEVYRFDEERKLVEPLALASNANHKDKPTFLLDAAKRPEERLLATALRNGTLLSLADGQKSTVLTGDQKDAAHSYLVSPMRSHEQTVGVILAVGAPGRPLIDPALHAAFTHLCFSAGEQLARINQTALREQVHRSEKLSVAGQLIHGVLTELRAPLENIRRQSQALDETSGEAIRREVERASSTVERIISVARAEQIDSRPVALKGLFEKLETSFRATCHESLSPQFHFPVEAVEVLGSPLQLQKVFENLLQHAHAAARHSVEKYLVVNLSRIARSAVVEIEFSGPYAEGEGPDFDSHALGLAISRGLVQSHGGDIRFSVLRPGRFRYETELPCLSTPNGEDTEGAEGAKEEGEFTVLLVEPEENARRRVLSLFAEMPHRLVPVSSIDDAVEFAEKIRFDLVLSSLRPEGGVWTELFHRIHHRAPHFAVMSESIRGGEAPDSPDDDPALKAAANLLDGRSASMIAKPVERADLDRILASLEARGGE
ncbi:MAG: hypothetical protein NW208_15635 [Bryobacter sp.]|nr:hypothetical protein [Bryobacter sp.]